MRDLKTAMFSVLKSQEITLITIDLLKNRGSFGENEKATWENHLIAQALQILTSARTTSPSETDLAENAKFILILKHTSET
jgi:hypothetical protein